jgi:predicted ATP-grasp superfamily ATP-dependent carboligase
MKRIGDNKMETTIDVKMVRTYQLSKKDRNALKIPITETRSIKYILKSDSHDGDQVIDNLIKGEAINVKVTCIDSIHPVKFTRKQIEFIKHIISEKGNVFLREKECQDILDTIDKQ